MADRTYLIAVDGGGTKTEAVLFRPDGHVVSQTTLPASNPNTVGRDEAAAVLCDAIGDLLRPLGITDESVAAVFAGIAGCSDEGNRQALLDALGARFHFPKTDVRSDIFNVINSAPADCGVFAVCGTGSSVFAKDADTLHRLGGWGSRFDEGGSAYDLGLDALRAALAERDGLGGQTAITRAVEDRLGGKVFDSIAVLSSADVSFIASFADTVTEAYAAGDGIAGRIIEKSAARLAHLIESALRLYGCQNRAALSGGLISHCPPLADMLREKLADTVEVVICTKPQIYGAASASMALAGLDADEGFERNFSEDHES